MDLCIFIHYSVVGKGYDKIKFSLRTSSDSVKTHLFMIIFAEYFLSTANYCIRESNTELRTEYYERRREVIQNSILNIVEVPITFM